MNTASVSHLIKSAALSSVTHNKLAVCGHMKRPLQLSEWSAGLLFTFPATCSYLLLITPPRSVVTKTQSNPPRSAPHHIDRHAH